MTPEWIRPLFYFSALYDILLGIAFGSAWRAIYARFGLPAPGMDAYVELPAALIAVFGVGFWFVARAPREGRDLIVLGILMKLAFALVVLGNFAEGAMPLFWVPFAVADVGFAIAFVMALASLGPRKA